MSIQGVGGVGGVGGAGGPAPAAQAPAAASTRVADGGQAAAAHHEGGHDGVQFSEELDEEGGPQGVQHEDGHHGDHKAGDANQANDPAKNNPADDPKKAEEQKRKEDEEKLKELDRKINDDQAQLEEAIKKGDQKEATRLNDELGNLLGEREALAKQLQGGQQQRDGAVPAAGAGNQAPQQAAPMQQAPMQQAGPMGGGQPMGGGNPMGGGMPQGGQAFPSGMMQGGPGNPAGVSANDSNPIPPTNLQGDDRKTADFINNYLQQKGSPAASQQAGELMVQYGKQYKVDPLILLSIAGQETNFGKTGIGANGMLGVGAYDNDPNNATRNPTFAGVANQIRVGAETFAKLRARGGSSDQDSVAGQAAAVNRAGWATDPNWHNGVSRMYSQISRAADSQQA